MSGRAPRGLALIAIAYLAYVSLGLPDGLLGVAWPSMRGTFTQPLDALGPLLAAGTIGYLASSTAVASLLARMSIGVLLGASCAATATALLLIASAPAWPVVIAAGLLLGAGGGAIDAGLNTHFATHHGPRTMSWLHASYGVGAFVGPLVMTGVLAASLEWRWGYALVAAAQLALAGAFLASRRGWPRLPAADARPRVDRRGALRLLPARLGVLSFFLYTGIEAGAGQWTFTLMTEGRGEDPVAVGFWVSAFYVALTAGRIGYGAVANAVTDVAALRACIAACVAGALLVALDLGSAPTVAGLVLLGLACAPIYPALIAATPRRVGEAHTAATVGSQVGAAVLGAAVFPGLMGVLAQRTGLESIAWTLVLLSLALLAVHELLARSPGPGQGSDRREIGRIAGG